MKSLGDVFEVIKSIDIYIALFGCTAKGAKELKERYKAIGDAICDEQGLKADQAFSLPADTPLGDRSANMAFELKAYYEKHAYRHPADQP